MKMTYRIEEGGAAITCLRCGLTSYNPQDVENKFCGRCGWHEDPPGVVAFREYMRARMRDVTVSVPEWKRRKAELDNLTQDHGNRKCQQKPNT